MSTEKPEIQETAGRLMAELDAAGLPSVDLPQQVHGVFGQKGYIYDNKFTIVIQTIGGLNTNKINESSLPLKGAMQILKGEGRELIKVTVIEGMGGIADVFMIKELMALAYINVTSGPMQNLGGLFGNNSYGFRAEQHVEDENGLLTAITRGIQKQIVKNKEA